MTKRAIIMGATSGLGKGVALGLLKNGYTIGIAGRRSEELEKIKALAQDKVFTKYSLPLNGRVGVGLPIAYDYQICRKAHPKSSSSRQA